MSTIKNLLMTAALFASTMAFAQQAPDNCCNKPGDGSKKQGCPMEQLNLSADQKAKLQDLQKVMHQKDSTLFSDFKIKKEQLKAENLKAVKSILNKEQIEKFEKIQAEKKECKGDMKCQCNNCKMKENCKGQGMEQCREKSQCSGESKCKKASIAPKSSGIK